MAVERLVRVQGLGLDERFKSMLKVFFTRSCGGQYRLTNEAADLILVDLDAAGARDAYASHRETNTRLPSILFSLDEQEYRTRGNVVLLNKPFTVRQLQSAFEIISLRYLKRMPVRSSNKGGIADVSLAQPTDTEQARPTGKVVETIPPAVPKISEAAGTFHAAFSLASHKEYVKINTLLPGIATKGENELEYDPERYLQSELIAAYQAAGKQGKNAVIKVAGGTLTIDPAQALVKMGMGNFQLREVASFPLNNSNFKLALVPAAEQPVVPDGRNTIMSLRALIWQSALYAGRGRVPRGTDLDTPIRLRRWPNLTRLLLTPDAVRVSALWSRQAVSIKELARQLGVSVNDVASFYSAAQALELFHGESDSSVRMAQVVPRKQQDGLLSRILKRLRS